jgi:hypothetical protein
MRRLRRKNNTHGIASDEAPSTAPHRNHQSDKERAFYGSLFFPSLMFDGYADRVL